MGRWWRGFSRVRGAGWSIRRSPSEQAAGERAAGEQAADPETAELTAAYWRAYDQRLATVKFSDVARRFPALIGQALNLGWSASRRDTPATIRLNLAPRGF